MAKKVASHLVVDPSSKEDTKKFLKPAMLVETSYFR
jgi:hypothetical protein